MPAAIFARLKNALLVLLVLWVSTTLATAASPSLGAIRPVGAQRGTEIEVTLSGARLGDAKEIFYYQPGITTVSLARVDDNTVKAKLKIAAAAPLGLHELRVRTASGISELRTFSVGALKDVSEVEPNNDFAAPQAIPMNVTVTGVADNEDVDYYAVEARKGDRITAEVEGMRLGITLFDPCVAILNTKRFELASSDDAALIWQDGFASILAPEDGKYIIQVRESAYAGNTSCLYRLHVGNFPRPTGLLPAGGKLGEKLTVHWIGDPAGEATTEVTLPAASVSDFGLYRQDPKGASPYPNSFRLTTLPNVLEKEPNDDQAHATPFTIPMALNGVIDKPGDVDQYVFTGKKGQTYDFRLFGRQIRSPLDSVMFLGKKGAGAAVGNDDSTGPDSYFRFTCPEDAEYVVWVLDHLRKGGPDYVYRIEVTPVEPRLALATNTEQIPLGTGAMAISVPRGNRQAALILGTRNDFGGDLNLSVQGLPPGMAMAAPAMAASPGGCARALHSQARRTLGRLAGQPRRQAGRSQAECTLRVHFDRGPGSGPEQCHRLVPHCRPACRGRDRGVPLLDRDRRAQGAARAERLDGAEGSRQPQAGIQVRDLDLPPLEPAGRRLGGWHRHS